MAGRFALRVIDAAGSPRAIGRALGEEGRAALRAVALDGPYWRAATDPAHTTTMRALTEATAARFPAIHEEIAGLAEGLGLPFDAVMAWQGRGDLVANTGDGCTSVQWPGAEPVIGHNEDGLPGFCDHAFLARVMPEGAPDFLSFCYPGSIPGHTFAVTGAGIAQAVNNIRLRDPRPEIPRMVVSRAVLACESLDQAVALIRENSRSGGFHITLAQAGDARLLSAEYGGGAASVVEIASPAVHANHALHLETGAAGQAITPSSADRQARGEVLLAAGRRDPLAILRDTGGAGLPIFRTAPDDPDDENTVATALITLASGALRLTVCDPAGVCRDIV